MRPTFALPICSICMKEKIIVFVDSDGKNYCKECRDKAR